MRTVTYGVTGLIDWNAQITVGRARLSVHFSGGAITKYGVTPAEYTTSDPITQRLIEDSEYYRSGKVRILRCSGRAEQVALSRKTDLATREAYAAATLPLDIPLPERDSTERPDLSDGPHPQAVTVPGDCVAGTPPPSGAGQILTFTCLEDARQYLMEHHHVPSLSIRTVESVTLTAAQHGITIKIEHP